MAEMTKDQIRQMGTLDIIIQLRRAVLYERSHKAITWEHGVDIVNIIAVHGDKIANTLSIMMDVEETDNAIS